MKKATLIIFSAILGVVGCTTVEQATRISTPLKADEFNSVSSQYMARPTFVSTEKMSDGKSTLLVHMDTYGLPQYLQNSTLPASTLETMKYSEIRFLKENVPAYTAAIDKYLEWAALAKERKDQFTKDIAKVPTWGQSGANVSNSFSFHSGNDREHFLVIAVSSMGMTGDGAQFFDETSARELKRLLLAFASDSLQQTNIDAVYK